MTDRSRDAWLSLDEAAARWGLSRLRLREAIACGALEAQRDNRGFWRVSGDVRPDVAGLRPPPDKLMEALFDEIEELNGALEERGEEVERLKTVAARQHAALERALALAEDAQSPAPDVARLTQINERSQALVGRALATLEQRQHALDHMNGLMTRALDTAAGLDAELKRQQTTTETQRALLDRVFELARASLERLAGERPRRRWFLRRGERDRKS